MNNEKNNYILRAGCFVSVRRETKLTDLLLDQLTKENSPPKLTESGISNEILQKTP